jgi:hypothetical protein
MQCNLQRNLITVGTTTKKAEKDDCSSLFLNYREATLRLMKSVITAKANNKFWESTVRV